MVLEILGMRHRKAMCSQDLKNLVGAREVRMCPLDRTSHRRKCVDGLLEDVAHVSLHREASEVGTRDEPNASNVALERVAEERSGLLEREWIAFIGAPEGSLIVERGNIDVRLPAGANTELDAEVTRGEIEIAEGLIENGEVTAHHARGTVGAGGPRLMLRSSRGWIRVHGR